MMVAESPLPALHRVKAEPSMLVALVELLLLVPRRACAASPAPCWLCVILGRQLDLPPLACLVSPLARSSENCVSQYEWCALAHARTALRAAD